MAEKRLHVRGMTCKHCEASVTSAVAEVLGVEAVSAHAGDELVTVTFGAHEPAWAEVAAAIDAQGFEVVGDHA